MVCSRCAVMRSGKGKKTHGIEDYGDWHVNKVGDRFGVFDPNGHQRADVMGFGMEHEEATAYLMAAAPAMWKALHEIASDEQLYSSLAPIYGDDRAADLVNMVHFALQKVQPPNTGG
jgi:hypothetical protein